MFRCIGSSGAGTLGGSVWDRAAELFASRQGCASEQSTRPRWPGRCSTQHTGRALGSESWHTWVGYVARGRVWGTSVVPGCGERREPERGVTQPCFCARRGDPCRCSLRLQYSGPVFSTGAYGSPSRLPPPFPQGPLQRRRLLGLLSQSILI